MNRRRLLGALGASAALGATGLGAAAAAIRFRPHPYWTSLEDVGAWLESHPPSRLTSTGAWSVAQILSHGAQSIELTLTGFPAPKPAWFRHTVGPTAFALFSGLGGMRHGLSEVIPGTDLGDLLTDPVLAHRRLLTAIASFRQSERLMPHFAYGELSHEELDRAHAMHISEHLVEIPDQG